MESVNETIPLREQCESKIVTKKSFLDNLRKTRSHITIEPTVLLFIIPVITTHLANANLYLEKACRVTLKYGDEVCNNLKIRNIENYQIEEQAVQKLVLSLAPWKSLITTLFPCILSLLYGSWTDLTGKRKWCMYMSIIGEIVVNAIFMLNLVFFEKISIYALMVMEAVPAGLGGSICIMLIGVYSYISDITTAENRTFRMGLVSFGMSVAFPVGSALSGVVLKNLGFYGVYGLSASIHILNLLYCIFCVKNPPRNKNQKSHDGKGFVHFVKTFFNPKNVTETVRVVFKKGPNNRRLRVCVLLVVVAILFGPLFGEMSILYLSTRYRFQWDEVKFSMFATYNFITHTIGTMFSITVFSKCLQWPDAVLGIISTVSKIFGSYFYCFARTGFEFYLAPLVEILNGTSLLALRSIISKLVAADELGKVNSIFGLAENLMPLVYVPLYTQVYKATMETLPGAVFLMGAGLTAPALVVFIWLLVEHIRNKNKETATSEKNLEALSEKADLKLTDDL